MPDDWSMGEVVRRLDRIEQHLADLGVRLVPLDLYTRDRAELERRIAEVEREIEALERRADDAARQSGTNVRQAVYSGLIPGVLFLISILITITQARGGK